MIAVVLIRLQIKTYIYKNYINVLNLQYFWQLDLNLKFKFKFKMHKLYKYGKLVGFVLIPV